MEIALDKHLPATPFRWHQLSPAPFHTFAEGQITFGSQMSGANSLESAILCSRKGSMASSRPSYSPTRLRLTAIFKILFQEFHHLFVFSFGILCNRLVTNVPCASSWSPISTTLLNLFGPPSRVLFRAFDWQ